MQRHDTRVFVCVCSLAHVGKSCSQHRHVNDRRYWRDRTPIQTLQFPFSSETIHRQQNKHKMKGFAVTFFPVHYVFRHPVRLTKRISRNAIYCKTIRYERTHAEVREWSFSTTTTNCFDVCDICQSLNQKKFKDTKMCLVGFVLLPTIHYHDDDGYWITTRIYTRRFQNDHYRMWGQVYYVFRTDKKKEREKEEVNGVRRCMRILSFSLSFSYSSTRTHTITLKFNYSSFVNSQRCSGRVALGNI